MSQDPAQPCDMGNIFPRQPPPPKGVAEGGGISKGSPRKNPDWSHGTRLERNPKKAISKKEQKKDLAKKQGQMAKAQIKK